MKASTKSKCTGTCKSMPMAKKTMSSKPMVRKGMMDSLNKSKKK